jgi:hypothetical protein
MRRGWRGLGCGLWGRMLPSWREKAHEPCSRIASSLDCRLRHLVLRCRRRRLFVVAARPTTRRLSEPVRRSHSVASASSPPSPSRWSRHSSRWLRFNVSSRRRRDMGHSRFWEGAMICWRASRMARGAGSRDVTGEIARELRQRCSDEVHGGQRSAGTCLLRPGISDVNLFRYCQGVIYFDAQITNQCRLRADRAESSVCQTLPACPDQQTSTDLPEQSGSGELRTCTRAPKFGLLSASNIEP